MRLRLLACCLAALGLLAACGDDDTSTTDPGSTEPAAVDTTLDDTGTTASTPTTGTTTSTTEVAGPTTFEVGVAGGTVTGGGSKSVDAGTAVRIVITSDAADEAHLHGYDLEAELEPGVPATIEFTADLPGVWELELHEAGTLLLELEVR